jgi:RND family efflux transporter MFP subunit
MLFHEGLVWNMNIPLKRFVWNMNIPLKRKTVLWAGLFLIVTTLVVAGLVFAGRSKTQLAQAAPLEVQVVQVEQKDVPIYSEWIGTLEGMVNEEIKAQVTGYLLKQNYSEGSFVKKGQLLFEIDPRPLQAALDQANGDLARAEGQLSQANAQLLQANAQLAQAEANQGKAQLDVNRYTPLAKEKAVTEQDLDNAVQANLAAKALVQAANAGIETAKAAIQSAQAQVKASKAAVQTAQLNLGFTKITSLIDGVAGIARAQVGDLVSPSGQALTTVSTVDPIKVYFTASEQEWLDWNKRFPTEASRVAQRKLLPLDLILANGDIYPHQGFIYLSDREVNQTTGTIRIAGTFPNPENILRPGGYGRIRAATNMRQGALLVPQRAVTELQGSYQVAVVGPDNKVSIRTVKVAELIGSMWIIEDGLKPGERVVVEGVQKVHAGALVNPKPFVSPGETKGG